MKKVIMAFAAFTVFAFSAKAQSPKVSLAINAGIPTEEFYSISFGADVQADFPVAEGTSITGSVGYQNFSIKEDWGGGSTYVIPLLAGAKFNLGSPQLYGHAQLGYGFGKGGGGSFSYAPSIGYRFSENLDASVKYLAFSEDGSTLGTIGVRLAYNF